MIGGKTLKDTLSNFGKTNLQQANKKLDTFKQYSDIKNLTQKEADDMLTQEVKKQKQNGTFDFQKLQQQVDLLKEYLPEKDFLALQKLLQSLK